MKDDVLDIPSHLRDAVWKVESAGISPVESDGLLVCGVGGSAIGGDLAVGALGHRLKRPLVVVRGYELPDYADERWSALCSSFSGDTEETVSCWRQARERDLNRIVATTGGELGEAARGAGDPIIGLPGIIKQPRAAVGYMLVSALAAARASAAAPSLVAEVEEAAAWLEGEREPLQAESAGLAERIGGRIPVVFGAGLTAPVARRWKSQVNENSKRHSFASEIPEVCHNEVVAWGIRRGECGLAATDEGDGSQPAEEVGGSAHRQPGSPARPDLFAILLADADQHPQERRRIEILARMVTEAGAEAEVIETRGGSRTARLVHSVMLGDLVSLDLAARGGVDPVPIPPIDRLKGEL